ncbi:MAG: SDR family oxidoreductase [Deltaproteobacteria bacterium]|nr:SDR family oxidoreductase [Deltaproteobacteria bacterium]
MPKILVGEFVIRKIRNIRVVAIAPGYVNTAILRGMNPEALAAILKDVHSGRLVEPEEIAASIMHCIENDAINATTIEVTGGLTYARSRAK